MGEFVEAVVGATAEFLGAREERKKADQARRRARERAQAIIEQARIESGVNLDRANRIAAAARAAAGGAGIAIIGSPGEVQLSTIFDTLVENRLNEQVALLDATELLKTTREAAKSARLNEQLSGIVGGFTVLTAGYKEARKIHEQNKVTPVEQAAKPTRSFSTDSSVGKPLIGPSSTAPSSGSSSTSAGGGTAL